MTTFSSRALLAVALLTAAGCAHTTPTVTPAMEVLRPRDLYPLRVGNKWTYEVRSAGSTGISSVEVLAEEDGFFVDSQHGRLKQDARGLRDADRYLIEAPIQKGHSWFSVQSVQSTERFEIPSEPHACTVKAGTFGRCAKVKATIKLNAEKTLVIESTYAEGVGLVSLHTEQFVDGRSTGEVLDRELISYHLAP